MAESPNLFFDDDELADVDADAEVYVAAAILDRVKPGWRDRINASTLDLTSNDLCVLGQLYGHYRRGLVSLRDGLVDAAGCKAFFHGPDIRAAWLREIYAVRDEDARLIPTS
jgi:hypothetical protein